MMEFINILYIENSKKLLAKVPRVSVMNSLHFLRYKTYGKAN